MNNDDSIITDSKKQFLFLLCISLGAFMANIDISIVNVSLPTISKEFNVTMITISYIILAYQIMETCFLLFFGKLGDTKGFKKIYLFGFVVFTIASALCGFSSNIYHLIFFRILQGLGGAALFAVMMASIAVHIPLEKRCFGMAIVTTAAAAGVALGPPIGGYLDFALSWRWIFWVNIPIGIIAVILGIIYIPSSQILKKESKIDIVGTITSFIFLFLLIYVLQNGHHHGWFTFYTIFGALLFVASIITFIIWEKRCESPLIDFKIFKNKNFTLLLIASLPSFMASSGLIFILPFYFEKVRGLDTRITGLIILSMALGQFLGPWAGRLGDKLGVKKMFDFGMLLNLISFIILVFLRVDSPIYLFIAAMTIFGISLAFSKAPNVQLGIKSAPPEYKGVTASTFGLGRSLALLLGVLFFEKVFTIMVHGINLDTKVQSMGYKHLNIDPAVLYKGFFAVFVFGLVISSIGYIFAKMVKIPEKA